MIASAFERDQVLLYVKQGDFFFLPYSPPGYLTAFNYMEANLGFFEQDLWQNFLSHSKILIIDFLLLYLDNLITNADCCSWCHTLLLFFYRLL